MKRLDYYALMATLLIGGGLCLYFKQDVYAGMFLGVFFTFIKDILGIDIREEDIIEIPDFIKQENETTISTR